jgi:hypothetical protein
LPAIVGREVNAEHHKAGAWLTLVSSGLGLALHALIVADPASDAAVSAVLSPNSKGC